MPKVTRTQIASYGIAVLAVVLALAIVLVLDSWLGMAKTHFCYFSERSRSRLGMED